MAHYDHMEASRKKSQQEAYENLKKSLTEKDKNEKLNPYSGAYFHILEMEEKIKKQKKKIEKYENFFSLLGDLLPKSFSYKDVIR